MRATTPEPLRTLHRAYWDWIRGRRLNKLVGLTKDEWSQWWIDTGKFDQRGTARGCYYMARIDKELPFSLDNIELKQKNGRGKQCV